ncbi:MAG: hypothetical protein DI537_47415 [Stutzerimonas stutzeri]|nr:MAG: hypothetical protein DI537_47415 [Stutzerimonas stutzeri]
MSNRKLRTARADFLYEMAREGTKFFGARTEQDVLIPLEKDGLVKRKRTQARDPQGTWKGDRRRNTFWEITEKGWALLAKRGSANDQRMRVHQNNRNIPHRIDRYFNRVRGSLHDLIVDTINFPEPGAVLKISRTDRRGPAKRRRYIR